MNKKIKILKIVPSFSFSSDQTLCKWCRKRIMYLTWTVLVEMIFSNYKYSIYYVNTRGEEQPGNRPAPRITQGKKRCWIGSGSFSNSIGVETRLLTCESQIGFARYIRSDAFKINSLYFFFFSFFLPYKSDFFFYHLLNSNITSKNSLNCSSNQNLRITLYFSTFNFQLRIQEVIKKKIWLIRKEIEEQC